MKNFTLLIVCLCFAFNTYAQGEYSEGYDVRSGVGISLLDTPTTQMQVYEAEVNYKMCPFITYSGAFNFGQLVETPSRDVTFYQLNGNLFISPLRNNKKHDLRIGGGISYGYHINNTSDRIIRSGQIVEVDDNPHRVGYNLILEHTTKIGKYFTIGGKIFMQQYGKAGYNKGLMMKVGVRL